jgi:hypothetical protein
MTHIQGKKYADGEDEPFGIMNGKNCDVYKERGILNVGNFK